MPLLICLVVSLLLGASALRAATAPLAGAARRPFIAGAPDRLAAPGDRRLPRRHHRVDSAVLAHADVDALADPTWLAHEVEGYARRGFRCAPPPAECRRSVEQLGGRAVVRLASGGRGELLWTAGRHAVRLAWRRVVETPTGTMTVEQPPADFLAELVAAWPSDLVPFRFDAARQAAWAEEDEDRRLYYLERAVERLERADRGAGAARRFAHAHLPGVAAGDLGAPPLDGWAEQPAALAALRRWLAGRRLARGAARQCVAVPWCAPLPLVAARP